MLLWMLMVSHGVILYPSWSIIDSDQTCSPRSYVFLSLQTRLIFYPSDFHNDANNSGSRINVMGIETHTNKVCEPQLIEMISYIDYGIQNSD
ncbi:unnamed protein product [Macrosiphum euphorbiae]|uniref:Uncharacterized protein n=1 Tax=Macrosiphum euphorbiae TaxID=13131 RepID=A0AAV0VIQ6_9HEMI|nr:unnamed protein product [Macrosiphum euphorbiae]